MVCGATGTRLHAMKVVHAIQQEEVACGGGEPGKISRPFDLRPPRHGSGRRGGRHRPRGTGARPATRRNNLRRADLGGQPGLGQPAAGRPARPGPGQRAAGASSSGGDGPDDLGHLNAHGLSTRTCDADEAGAIGQVFGGRRRPLPVVAAKSYFGNLGAGSGIVELIASLLAMQQRRLFRVLNYETPDPDCPVAAVADDSTAPGDSFIKLSVTPQGQASGLLVRRFG